MKPLLALVACASLCLPQGQGTTLTVTKKETKLRTQKRALAPAVADLKEGDKLSLQSQDGVWYAVAFQQKSGFVHSSDVSDKKDVRLSGEGVRETYSASEQAAARKGFNPQVERQHRAQNPSLEPAFRAVDAIQARSVPEAEVERFLRDGRLLKGDAR